MIFGGCAGLVQGWNFAIFRLLLIQNICYEAYFFQKSEFNIWSRQMASRDKYLKEYRGLLVDLIDDVPAQNLFSGFTAKDAQIDFEKNLSKIQRYLSEHSPNRVSFMAPIMRNALSEISHGMSNNSVTKFKPSPRAKLIQASVKYPSLSPYLSVSGDGYLRQQAVVRWSKINTAFELALLLRRLNDWVPQVSKAAITKFEHLLALPSSKSGLSSDIILECMDLILDRDRFGRSREISFRVLNELLNFEGVREALDNDVMNSSLDSAPRYFKLGLLLGLFSDKVELLAVNAKHAGVRRTALLTGLNGAFSAKTNSGLTTATFKGQFNRNEILKVALKDKAASVKRVALDYILEHKLKSLHVEDTYRQLLDTPQVSIIDRCIYGLKILGFDKISETRSEILSGDNSKPSLALLSRYGDKKDGNIIYNLRLDVEEARVNEVLGYAAKLGNLEAIADLQTLTLNAETNNQARKVIAGLHRANRSMSFSNIAEALARGHDIIARSYTKSIHMLPTIKFAIVLAKLMQIESEYSHEYLWELLKKKRDKGAFMPSTDDIKRLKTEASNVPSKELEKLEKTLSLKLA
jgi:hypothetical protein